jgi:predicted amidohydrolase
MTRPLSPNPDLEQLKRQAKEIRRAHQAHDPAVCQLLRQLRRFLNAADDEIFRAPLSLHEAQYALAMDYGFASWNALKQQVTHATESDLPAESIRVALMSCQVRSGDKEANLRVIEDLLRMHADSGIELFVFPDLSISGYPHSCQEIDCAACAESIPDGPSAMRVAELARRFRTVVCAGLVEECEGRYFYTHFLCGPDGYIGKQRKLFPARGLMNVEAVSGGEGLTVHHIFGHQCVILACADWLLPEGIYLAAMSGAALIISPTDGMSQAQESILRNRALTAAMDTEAHLVAAFGGDSSREGEVMAGLIVDGAGSGELLLCETRSADEVKVMQVELNPHTPQHRWGGPNERAPRLLANLMSSV